MKPFIICIACSFLFFQNIKSQNGLASEQQKKHPALSASVTFIGSLTMKVYIMGIKDSSVFVHQKSSEKPNPFHRTNIYMESGWDKYSYRTIESIRVTNNKLRSWLLPVSIVGGIVAGALIGYAAAKKDGGFEVIQTFANDGAGIVIGGILGGGLGVLTGLTICNASDKKYLIHGDWMSFEEMKRSMNY
jgi:hypothetical protein